MSMFDEVRCEYRLPPAAAPERWAAGRGKAARQVEARVVAEESEPEVLLLRNLRGRKAELKSQLKTCSDHWGYEDGQRPAPPDDRGHG